MSPWRESRRLRSRCVGDDGPRSKLQPVGAAGTSWLVRGVPGLILGGALVAMAVAMLLAAHSGVNAPVSKQVSIGPFDVRLVYSTPTAQLVVAGLITTVAARLLVAGLDAWAAKRVTRRARYAVRFTPFDGHLP